MITPTERIAAIGFAVTPTTRDDPYDPEYTVFACIRCGYHEAIHYTVHDGGIPKTVWAHAVTHAA